MTDCVHSKKWCQGWCNIGLILEANGHISNAAPTLAANVGPMLDANLKIGISAIVGPTLEQRWQPMVILPMMNQ